jgi:hypothetical protein
MTNLFDDVRAGLKVRPGYWFAPKQFGLGATPVTWQGWALLAGYAAAILLLARFRPGGPIGAVVLGVVLTAVLLYVSWLKTDGGWSWRWGPKQ